MITITVLECDIAVYSVATEIARVTEWRNSPLRLCEDDNDDDDCGMQEVCFQHFSACKRGDTMAVPQANVIHKHAVKLD